MCSVCTVADVARQPITRGRRGKESATGPPLPCRDRVLTQPWATNQAVVLVGLHGGCAARLGLGQGVQGGRQAQFLCLHGTWGWGAMIWAPQWE